MQITCPSCAAAYAVPEEKLVGRAVKCAQCGTQWTPVPEPILSPPPLDPLEAAPHEETPPEDAFPEAVHKAASPKPEPPEPAADAWSGKYQPLFGTQWPQADLAQPPHLYSDQPSGYETQEPQPRSKALIVAWVASIALLGAVVIACFVNRADIMQDWPPSQRVYAVFGLH